MKTNKGYLILFDATLGIDMDEMDFAYYADLPGIATKNLPILNTFKSVLSEDKRDFSWEQTAFEAIHLLSVL